MKLLPGEAPKTVKNFVELAEGKKEWTDPKTGQKKWTTALNSRAVFRTSPTGADGKIYFMNEAGEVWVLSAGDGAAVGWLAAAARVEAGAVEHRLPALRTLPGGEDPRVEGEPVGVVVVQALGHAPLIPAKRSA